LEEEEDEKKRLISFRELKEKLFSTIKRTFKKEN